MTTIVTKMANHQVFMFDDENDIDDRMLQHFRRCI